MVVVVGRESEWVSGGVAALFPIGFVRSWEFIFGVLIGPIFDTDWALCVAGTAVYS